MLKSHIFRSISGNQPAATSLRPDLGHLSRRSPILPGSPGTGSSLACWLAGYEAGGDEDASPVLPDNAPPAIITGHSFDGRQAALAETLACCLHHTFELYRITVTNPYSHRTSQTPTIITVTIPITLVPYPSARMFVSGDLLSPSRSRVPSPSRDPQRSQHSNPPPRHPTSTTNDRAEDTAQRKPCQSIHVRSSRFGEGLGHQSWTLVMSSVVLHAGL